jgi:hypothetical protein
MDERVDRHHEAVMTMTDQLQDYVISAVMGKKVK